jgi:nucleoside-diphosphate-sugar epimerase
MNACAFVTGGNGFIGSHLIDRLLREGFAVRALVRDLAHTRFLPAGVEPVRGDLDDLEALRRGARGTDAVYHLAALTKAPSEEVMFRVNLAGTERIASACAEVAPGARFVFLSSQAAGGPSLDGRPVTETSPPAPCSGYGRSKLEAERTLEAMASRLRLTIVRPPAVYGPRDHAFLVLFRIAARFGFLVQPRGARRLSIIHVADLIDGIRLAADRGSGTYYLTGGDAHPLPAILAAVAAAVGRPGRIVTVPPALLVGTARLAEGLERALGREPSLTSDRARQAVISEWVCSDARARSELGYRPTRAIDEGMRETASWYRERGWLR